MSKIYGQLEEAQLQNKTSDPTPGVDGKVWLNTTTSKPKIDIGSAVHEILTHDSSNTVTNKTINGASNTLTVRAANDITGTLPQANGGTGFSTYTTGDVLYASAANTLSKLGIGSSGQVLKQVGGVPTWATFSGGINYFSSNPDAEADTTGWTGYDDSAATPVDLTGGTFSPATWTRSTSSPLRGSANFLFTPSAAGKGIAFTITPERADYGQVLAINIDAEYTTATAAEGDYTVWVYDVANSALIQPAPYKLPGGVTGLPFKWQGTFQVPTNATTLRVAIHQAASTSALLKVDNISCGPQAKSFGPVVTDWVAYTPTFTNFGTVTPTFWSRRVGDSLEFHGYFAAGTGSASAGSFTLGYGGVNNNVSVDYTKTAASLNIGEATVNTSSTTLFGWPVVVGASSAIHIGKQSSTTNGQNYENGSTFNGLVVYVYGKVPIAGWSSGQLLSSDADTRVVAVRANLTSSTGSITSATQTDLVFNSTNTASRFEGDTHAAYNTSTGIFTAPVSGWYQFDSSILLAATTSLSSAELRLADASNNAIARLGGDTSLSGTSGYLNGSAINYFSAGQQAKIRVYIVGSGTLTVYGDTTNHASFLSIHRVSGPSQIAASESVIARYASASSQAVTNSAQVFDMATKIYDSHGSVSGTGTGLGGTWKFTAPVSGKYNISATVYFTGAAPTDTAARGWYLRLKKNGTIFANGFNFTAGHTTSITSQPAVTATIDLLAGDYIQLTAEQNINGSTVGTGTDATLTYIDITRVGN